MKSVLVLGASGIVGQYMRLTKPSTVKGWFYRREKGAGCKGFDLSKGDLIGLLENRQPDVIVNLAGESRPDVVEKDPSKYRYLNVDVPAIIAGWAHSHQKFYVHASTQGVFVGGNPPYSAYSRADGGKNEYGAQKAEAEWALAPFERWVIARLTFVIGARLLRGVGRRNPIEDMLDAKDIQRQVYDRFFSPIYAGDAAQILWRLALTMPEPRQWIVNIGIPITVSRYEMAISVRSVADLPVGTVEPVPHSSFVGIADRPRDTTWADGALFINDWMMSLKKCVADWRVGMDMWAEDQRVRELVLYFSKSENEVRAKLAGGFPVLHKEVAADFNQAKPKSDADLLQWYAETEAYIWELTAYHLNPGFNYKGMCEGIVTHLDVCNKPRVLCLGDGIGDLTLRALEKGLSPTYHDLATSTTADFAMFRIRHTRGINVKAKMTHGWEPVIGDRDSYDAVVALDYLEHVPNVEEWTREIFRVLVPGGIFLAQNAFGIGSGEEGSIPMHLTVNDKYVTEWVPLLEQIGFISDGNGWWRKPVEVS